MLGRLRLASKGLVRDEQGELVEADDATQTDKGLYMLGQVATLRSQVCGIPELHRNVCEGASHFLDSAARLIDLDPASNRIAIIGIATLLPGARTPARFWRNMLDRVESIREVPPDRWHVSRIFDLR